MDDQGQEHETSANNPWSFLAGLLTGSLVGAGAMLLLAPQSGEKTRIQIRDKSLELRDDAAEGLTEAGHRAQEQAAVWQEKGKGVTEALSLSKDSIVQAVSESKDRVVAAVVDSKESNR